MDLMEFSMMEGNDTLTADENFLVPQLMQTPVVVNSILKLSTKDNLIQLHTPKPQQKHLKVKFETPHSVKKSTPTRYELIAELDEKENWIERTTIVTKQDHLMNIEYAKDILNEILHNLPISTTSDGKPVDDEDDETFFDASDENVMPSSQTPGTEQGNDILVQAPPETEPQDVSMMDCEGDNMFVESSDAITDDEPMECDETSTNLENTVLFNTTLMAKSVSVPEASGGHDIPYPVSQVTSPPIPATKGSYSIDFDELESMNPFQIKGGMQNSPFMSSVTHTAKQADDTVESSVMADFEVEEDTDLMSETLPDIEEEKTIEQKSGGENGIEDGVAQPDILGELGDSTTFNNTEAVTDPFATKTKVCNSPMQKVDIEEEKTIEQKSGGENGIEDGVAQPDILGELGDSTTFNNTEAVTDPFATKTKVCNSPMQKVDEIVTTPKRIVDENPFSTKSKVNNSPLAAETETAKNIICNNSNPFATKANVCNSPILPPDEIATTTSACEITTTPRRTQDTENIADPFSTISNVSNSPKVVNTLTTERTTIDDSNLPVTKTNVCNSPSPTDKPVAIPQETLDMKSTDPFATKSNVCNSPSPTDKPVAIPQETLDMETTDPFATKLTVANSPQPSSSTDGNVMENPFATKSNIVNSPIQDGPGHQENPFVSKSEEPNSPVVTQTVTVDNVPTDVSSIVPDTLSQKLCVPDPSSADQLNLDALDPFATKSQVVSSPGSAMKFKTEVENPVATKSVVANSPVSREQEITSGLSEDTDPFSTKSKICNPPPFNTDVAQEENPFVTKSKVVTSPTIPMDPFTVPSNVGNASKVSQRKNEAGSSEPNILPDLGTWNVGGRTTPVVPDTSSEPLLDFPEEKFTPATDAMFDDASVWDILEKFGSNSTNKVSDLARMSLYVKFDPLVDLAMADPRRVSMNLKKRASIMSTPRSCLAGKCLAEMCNAEESMLLMGTPPKKMSRHIDALLNQHRDHTPGSQPATPKAVRPIPLDLLCANTPPPSVKKESAAAVQSTLTLSEEAPDSLIGGSGNAIVEVLQYTEKDMSTMKASLFLEFQGQKMSMECGSTKVIDKLKAKLVEQQKDLKQMGYVTAEYEIIIEQLIQEKEKTKSSLVDREGELRKERDQALQDTQALENAFTNLHRRNEKLKEVITGFVKNEETLKAYAKDLKTMFTTVSTESKAKITELTQQLSKVQSTLELQTTKADIQVKRDKLQINSLQNTVDQKTVMNKELTQICDNLLASK